MLSFVSSQLSIHQREVITERFRYSGGDVGPSLCTDAADHGTPLTRALADEV